jgi:23S rRNA (cytosine1962-C5)-methyltransferase
MRLNRLLQPPPDYNPRAGCCRTARKLVYFQQADPFQESSSAHEMPTQPHPTLEILTSTEWRDYQLLDSGDGQKLERFGSITLIRPEAEAIWSPALSRREWESAHAAFQPAPEENGGRWQARKPLPERWVIAYKHLRCYLQTSASRHVGLFPEQACQWDWIAEQVHRRGEGCRVLNLFGYTGLASLAAAAAGAQVTHLDASRKVVNWARDNQILSRLENSAVRWIVDDALKFVQREARRGSHYDGIILDPPKFGRGPKGEVWEFYKLLPELLKACRSILSGRPAFLVLTAYAVKASAVTLYYALQEIMHPLPGSLQAGEIALVEQSAGRLLPTAIFARWSSVQP